MRWPRLASVGVTLTLALLSHGCGPPQAQQSGIAADVRVVGGPTIINQPHVLVTLTAQSTGFSESGQVLTGNAAVTVRLDLPPGQYRVAEAVSGDVICSQQTVVVVPWAFVPAHLSCDIR